MAIPSALDGTKDDVVFPTRRSRLPRAKRVGDIEAAARLVFIRRGFNAASIAEIASEAGVAEGTIYKFFESKRHLVVRVIEVWYDEMVAEFESNLPGIQGAMNKIRFIVWRHITSLKENRELARLCGNEARNAGDYYQSELAELNRRYTHVFLEACREGVANGELRKDLPLSLVRDLVFGGIEHHISPMLYGLGEVNPEESTEFIMRTLFEGIAQPDRHAVARFPELVQRMETFLDNFAPVAATGETKNAEVNDAREK